MNKDLFGILLVGGLGAGWALGASVGVYADSEVIAAGVSFGVPTALAILAASPINRAWWSANRQEATAPDFRQEATQSLRLAMFAPAGLAIMFGALALSRQSVYWAAFAGSLLTLSAFAALSRRDISARNFQ